jgi:malate dehydrogenase (oxaloacetate-decarboxylating)
VEGYPTGRIDLSHEEDLLKKAEAPNRVAVGYHQFYRGKMQTIPKCVVRSFDDFAIWYTPGVAEVCKAIRNRPEKVFEYTNRGNTVAIVNDGTRVLGLGNIGPEAGLPVMEGKALLFKYLGGVDAFPISLNTQDPEDIIHACKWMQPSFGGINLEDIEKPKCFYILDRLEEELQIPVWHDDRKGTATVATAGLINALKVVSKKIDEATVSMIGSGAANIAIAEMLMEAGVDPKKIFMVDSKGLLNGHRDDLKDDQLKWKICLETNGEDREGGAAEALEGTDACIAMSVPIPGSVKKEWVRGMQNGAIVFACANPLPEIWPWEASEAGAKIVATGRSDFPNQINNSLGFPAIFRGVLDVRAAKITNEMCLAATFELAKVAEDKGLSENYIIPTMDEWEVFIREAVAVGLKAIEQGIAGVKRSRAELEETSRQTIKEARDMVHTLMHANHIPAPPAQDNGDL